MDAVADHRYGHDTKISEPIVRLTGLGKAYGAVTAVQPINVAIAEGDFCAILGPSGCGKTTLLRMIAGFIAPSQGSIAIAGRDVTALGPEHRPTNMVFQSYGLFPHMTVAENIGFGLRIAKVARAERDQRVAEALALVRLVGLAERGVDKLSGGQQQRVALARALVMRPRVLLLDEPLAALDLKLRQAMQDELRRIHREIGGTFLFVTHDQGEAFHLANRVLVMNAGRIEQDGTPAEIYRQPATLFVANFVGEANVLAGVRRSDHVMLADLPPFASAGADGAIQAVVRPEAFTLNSLQSASAGSAAAKLPASGAPAFLSLAATITDAVFTGAGTRYVCTTTHGQPLIVRSGDEPALAIGTLVEARCPVALVRVLEA